MQKRKQIHRLKTVMNGKKICLIVGLMTGMKQKIHVLTQPCSMGLVYLRVFVAIKQQRDTLFLD